MSPLESMEVPKVSNNKGGKGRTSRTFRMMREVTRADGTVEEALHEVVYAPKSGRLPNAACYAEEEAVFVQACNEQNLRWPSRASFIREAVLDMLFAEGYELPDESVFIERATEILPVGRPKGS